MASTARVTGKTLRVEQTWDAVMDKLAAPPSEPRPAETDGAVRLLTEIEAYWSEAGVTRPALAQNVSAFLSGDYAAAEPLRRRPSPKICRLPVDTS